MNTPYYQSKLIGLLDYLDEDINVSWDNLKEETKIIMWGFDEEISFKDLSTNKIVKEKFEGVIPSLQRQYDRTDSYFIREKLTLTYLKTCTTCNGQRLNEVVRNVFADGMNLPEISSQKINDANDIINNLDLDGNKFEIAEKISKEILPRLSFLVDVGLDYLNLSRGANTLSGGEAQRMIGEPNRLRLSGRRICS